MPNLRCAVLLISAIALLVLWGGVANKIFIVLFTAFWIVRWKTIRGAMPSIDRKDVAYVAVAAALCVLSVDLFVVKYKVTLSASGAATARMLAATVAGIVMAIPFTASFVKLLRNAGRGQCRLPEPNFSVIARHWPRLCYAVGALGIAVMLAFSFSYDIWYDESCSLTSIGNGYSDMLRLATQDVHPPLYYLLLKTIVDGVQFLIPAIPAIFIAKAVSVLAYILLFVVISTKVRRDYGRYVASLGVVCLVGMHYMLDFGLEARMYSWGMCFVTLAFIEVKDVLAKGRFLDWALFVFFSLCAAYTHYFACVAVAFLYIVLLWRLWSISRKRCWHWVVALAVTIVGYLPWLAVFIAILHEVSQGYWIGPVSLHTFRDYVVCVVDNPLLLIAVLYLIARTAKSLRGALAGEGAVALTGVLVPVFVTAVGVAVSWLMRPIFIWRYLGPALCCFWLGVLILVSSRFNKQLRIVMAGLIVMVSVANMADFAYKQSVLNDGNRKLMSFLQSQPDTAAYIVSHDSRHIVALLSFFSGNDCFQWKESKYLGELGPEACGEGILNDAREISSLMASHQPVYFVVGKKRAEAELIDKAIEGCGLTYNYVGQFNIDGSYSIETPIIDIYRLIPPQREEAQP